MRRARVARGSPFGKDRAQAFARLEDALDEHHVARTNTRSKYDELIAQERVDPRFAVQRGRSYSICVVPENTDDPERRNNGDDVPDEAFPIQGSDEEAPAEAEGDFSNLLRNFEDAADLDDQVAADIDPGVDITDTPELPEDVDPALLDIGETIEPPSEFHGLVAEADDFGPTDDVAGADAIEPLPDPTEGDDHDGTTGDDIETTDLGEVAPEHEEEEAVPHAPGDDIGVTLDEDPPGPAVRPWLDIAVAPCPSRTVVASQGGGILAAGSDVSVFDESGNSTKLVPEVASLVTSVLRLPDGALFYTTLRGQLFRIDSREPECITAWTDVFDLKQPALALELGGMTPSSRPAMLLRVGNERKELLESTDNGCTFRRVDLGGQILAVSSGSPPVCLVKSDRAVRVLRSEPSGGFALTGATLRGDAKGPLVAAHGDVIAVLDPGRGVQVSADGGRSLRTVAGLASATAIAAGIVGGRPIVFAALFNSATETAKIACVDAASGDATTIAGVDVGDNEEGDHARVVSLAWNEHTETLWGAGAFGLRCWRRPPSA